MCWRNKRVALTVDADGQLRTALFALQARVGNAGRGVEHRLQILRDLLRGLEIVAEDFDRQAAVAAAGANATATDRGLGARWSAMHEHAAALPRLLCLLVFVALALLPLLLRRWRGDTTFDRRVAADLVRDQLTDAGIAVEDTPDGPQWTFKD